MDHGLFFDALASQFSRSSVLDNTTKSQSSHHDRFDGPSVFANPQTKIISTNGEGTGNDTPDTNLRFSCSLACSVVVESNMTSRYHGIIDIEGDPVSELSICVRTQKVGRPARTPHTRFSSWCRGLDPAPGLCCLPSMSVGTGRRPPTGGVFGDTVAACRGGGSRSDEPTVPLDYQ